MIDEIKTNKKIRVAVLISGRGSNLRALISASRELNFPAEIALVISNKQQALGLQIAKENNIKSILIDNQNFTNREEFDKEIARLIQENNCQLVCLAGFMRLLSGWFVRYFDGRLINIHPSLLPDFKGANAVEDALKAKVKYSGCTVHYVTEEMDSGPIIQQVKVEVLDNDTVKTLADRILEKEHVLYVQALKIICEKMLKEEE